MERAELAAILGGPASGGEPGGRTIAEAEPRRFMQAFAAALPGRGPVFLFDPAWKEAEVRAAEEQIAGGRDDAAAPDGWLMIPSGGSSGRVKFARHDAATLAAAVRGFCAHFKAERVHAVGVLPLHHVSGLMSWMRCALTGGEFVPWEWKRLEKGDRPPAPARPGFASLSLVPTQLQRLLGSRESVSWLRSFDAVILGGGPAWPGLLASARSAELPIILSYGMTETAAMVAAQLPGEFLAGMEGSGRPLPHARIEFDRGGRIVIEGASVCRGYFPGWDESGRIATQDLGEFDPTGALRILGRADALIITGGRKVDPAEVEAALRSSGEFADLAVIGLPDPEWGEVVAACYPSGQPPPDLRRAAAAAGKLADYKRPRRFVPIAEWPRSAQGKLNRAELARRAVTGRAG